ncbi:MAG: HAMP domain-containing protein [Hyphomicrobiaceae bacterium]|nr:MAG: HAMP domain-containing protein [Hyphomicrobiaceae bacterium]
MTALTRILSSSPFRLTLAYLGALVLAAVLIVGFIGWRANELLTTKVIETLTAEVVGLREQFQAGGPTRLRAIVNDRSAEPGSSLYLLVDETGRKVAGNLSRMPPELADAGQGGVFRYARAGEAGRRIERLAVGIPVAVPGGYTLVVGRDIEDQRHFADTMWQVAIWSVGLLSALGIGAGLLISRSVLRRIEAVSEASRTIMAGDLSRRIPLNGSGDELDRLAQSLNAMLARIEELMGALREVSDNIAHDLKTPLNRLRNHAEAALRNPDGPDTYRGGLVKTIEEADELIKTFNSLLLIARLEAGAVAESMVPMDPASIIGDVAELYEPVAEEAGLDLRVSAQEGVNILANRELVSQAVANLVDNAIKYSVEDGRPRPEVSISMACVGDAVEIAVADRGPGVAPEDRERAVQRFVRLEKSRSRPGSGLGLSLVAAVARLHGGSLRLEDNAPGLRAVLRLPTRGLGLAAGAGAAAGRASAP